MAQSDWMPMETAPKDGSIVLGFFPNMWLPGGDYRFPDRRWGMGSVRWDGSEDSGFYWSLLDGDSVGDPTHWMPLPDPPESEGENDE